MDIPTPPSTPTPAPPAKRTPPATASFRSRFVQWVKNLLLTILIGLALVE